MYLTYSLALFMKKNNFVILKFLKFFFSYFFHLLIIFLLFIINFQCFFIHLNRIIVICKLFGLINQFMNLFHILFIFYILDYFLLKLTYLFLKSQIFYVIYDLIIKYSVCFKNRIYLNFGYLLHQKEYCFTYLSQFKKMFVINIFAFEFILWHFINPSIIYCSLGIYLLELKFVFIRII